MSQTAEHTTHNTLDCDIDLTLPLDFVREWTALTTKQLWTAQVKNFGFNNLTKAGTHCASESQESTHREGMQTFLETDTSVIPDLKGRQKTYLCVRITGLQLYVENGQLQLTVLDVKGKSNAEDVQGNIKCDVITVPHDTVGQRDSVDSSFQRASENTSCQTVESTETFNSSVSVADNFSAGCQRSSPVSVQGTFADSKEDGAVGEMTQDTDTCTNLPECLPVVKKRRGRPRKNWNSPAVVIDQPVQNQAKGQPLIPTRPYSLRGKKLPSSIFGDSESDVEEAEDEEYLPTFKVPAEKNYAQGKQQTREGNEWISDDGTMDQGDHQRSGVSHFLTESDSRTEAGENFTKPVAQNNWQSSLSFPTKRKCGQPPHLASTPELRVKQPSGKKRMKIDVAGLPAFARRKRNRERKASCKYCRRKFCDFTGVTLHVKKFHGQEKDLEKYLLELKKLSVTKCSLCDKQFENRLQLQLHEDKAHFKTGDMQCDQCGKTFANMLLVKQHVRGVHLVKGQGHVCSICSAKFKWAASLKTHMADVHLGIRELACNVCGKKFHRQAQLNRHAIIHGPEEAKLACELCGRKFWYPNNLQRHMAIVHGPQNETWHCAYCGKGFPRKECLHNHVEKVHYSIFPHNCSVCRAGFIRPALLEKHMATEHGQVGFQAPPGRRAHFKYNRSELDELACGMCEDKFFYKTQLLQHVFQAHSDTFPFSCNVCQQVFMERSFLVLHRKKAHGLQPGPEDVEFDVEEAMIQQGISGLHPEMNSASRNVEDSLEGNALSVLGENSYIIKVENGDSTVQYVIQNPEGLHSAPSDTLVQDIAHLLLAAEQSSQQEHENVHESADHGPLPETGILQGNLVQHVARMQQDAAVPNGNHILTHDDSPAQTLVRPHNAFVHENAGVSNTVSHLAVNFETNQVLDHDNSQDLNLLTPSADLAGDNSRLHTVLVSGETIHNFTPDSANRNSNTTDCHLNSSVVDSENAEHHLHSANVGRSAVEYHMDTSKTDDTVTDCHLRTENTEDIVEEFHLPTASTEDLVTGYHVNNADVQGIIMKYHAPSAEVAEQPSSTSYSTDLTEEDFAGQTVYVTMESVPSTSGIQQRTVEMTPASDLQPMTLNDPSEGVVLDASDVFGSGALNQIIITTSSVDECDGVIFSADVVQGE